MGQIDINGAHCFDDVEAKMEKLSNTSEIDREIALASARMSDKAIREIIFRTRNHEASGTNSAENLARLAETELCVIENVAFSRRLEMPTDGHDFSDAELEIVAANTNWRNQPVASLARDLLSTRKELARLDGRYRDAVKQHNKQLDIALTNCSKTNIQLKETNGLVDDLGDFLLCVNEPHDTSCAHYRNENKPCDCEYDNLVKRFTLHRARLAKDAS